ncbi:MAG: helix-turn-helix transcriptional regulator [Lachnospiraceae bacterium]|nr:helix-turn-helix transcriptional regulator [Lachnospiraceae bacterium]
MSVISNPLGQDYLQFMEDTSAQRTGRRIQAIRRDKGISTSELGSQINLTVDRIRQYENGYRKPKTEMLQQMASALEVNTLALVDSAPVTFISTMFVFFELEQKYGLKPEMIGDRLVLSLDDSSSVLSDYLQRWHEKICDKNTELESVSAEEDRATIEKEYRIWKYTFPESIAINKDNTTKRDKLLEDIKKLQEQLKQLEDE